MVFCMGWSSFSDNALVVTLFWPDGLNTSFINAGLKLLKYLKVIESIHYSTQSFMGNQLIFSNSLKPIWALLFIFIQKHIHQFCRSFNFDLNFCWVRVPSWASALQSSLQKVWHKNLFFQYKNLSLLFILSITFRARDSPDR